MLYQIQEQSIKVQALKTTENMDQRHFSAVPSFMLFSDHKYIFYVNIYPHYMNNLTKIQREI